MRRAIVLACLVCVHAADAHPVCQSLPTAAPAAPRRAATCHRASARVAARVTAPIVEHYELAVRKGHVEVAFPCDGLGDRVDEIVVESGSGHGGTLDMWRARRRADGRFDVRAVEFHGPSMIHSPTSLHALVAIVALPDLDVARAAVTATVKEVDPPAPDGGFEISGSSSSNDFHAVVRLVDSDGHAVERRYTGYEGSEGQDRFRPLLVAMDALRPILDLTFDPDGPTPALAISDVDRELFADRFVAAVPHFDEPFYWWVMERYVQMTQMIGTPRVIPGLVSRMTFATSDRSHVDARRNALNAIAAITGWNPRQGGLTDEAAGKLVVADCR